MNFKGIAPTPARHYCISYLEFKQYRVFLVADYTGHRNLLTTLFRIEKPKGCSKKTGVKQYLKLRTEKKWADSEMVGRLLPTKFPWLFYGYRINPDTKSKSLIIFDFSKKNEPLIVDVYDDWYPNDRLHLEDVLKSHIVRF